MDANTLPSAGVVVGGSASLDYTSPGQLHVYQSTDRVQINWDSFNIGSDALAQFHQPSSSSIAVNKVTGTFEPTQIFGALKANGQVIILDQNGVIFGENSSIDVGSIVVGTGSIDTNTFMSGANVLEIDDIKAGSKIINNGTITVAEAGLAAFVAPTVINNNIIQAKMGRVALASGSKVTVDLYGDGLVEVAPSQAMQESLVHNKGVIQAEGGAVLLTASTAQGIVDSVINTSGLITVASAKQDGGKIILEGSSVGVSGTLDASGVTGGGEILVGGDYKGGGDIRTATTTTITEDATIKANTTGTDGDGGKVIIWSDEQTVFAGTIEANAGSKSGDGGFIETSSKEKLNVRAGAVVSASAENGKNGQWLLDPRNVYLRNAAGTNASGGGAIHAGSDNEVVDTTTIETALNNGLDVTITTGTTGTQDGDIFVEDHITKNNGGAATLTLRAQRNISIDSANVNNTSGSALNVVLNADSNADNNGAVSIQNSSISTGGGYFIAGGGSGDVDADGDGILGNYNPAHVGLDGIIGTADDVIQYGADVRAAWGNSTLNFGFNMGGTSLIETGAGAIFINGNGYVTNVDSMHGVNISGGTLRTSEGNITIKGTSGGNNSSLHNGISLAGASSLIETTDGAVYLLGQVLSSSVENNHGISMLDGADIIALNDGTIYLEGIARGTGVGNQGNDGIRVGGSGTNIVGKNGSITLKGTGAGVGGFQIDGVVVFDSASVTSDGTGNIILEGVTPVNGASHWGVRVDGSRVTQTGGGDIIITGTTNTGGDINVSGLSEVSTSGGAGNGAISLTGNSMTIGATPTISAAGTLAIKTRTNNRVINLGNVTTGLSLVDSELERFSARTLVIGDTTSYIGDINIDSWDFSGKTFNLEVYGNDITIQDAGSAGYGMRLGTGDVLIYGRDNDPGDKAQLSVNASILKTAVGTSRLDLHSDRDIVFSSGNITASGTGVLNIALNSDRDADQDGAISITNSAITTNGGWFVAGGGSGTVDSDNNGILGDGGTGADMIAAYGNAAYAVGIGLNNGDISTGAGSLILNGHGRNNSAAASNLSGIYMHTGSLVQSGAGAIRLNGTGGNGEDSNHGIYMTGAGTGIQSTTGAIRLDARGGSAGTATSADNTGLLMESSAYIHSLGNTAAASTITVDARGGAGNNANYGAFIIGGANISSISGAIDITGTGGVRGAPATVGTDSNHGFVLYDGGYVSSTGTGVDAATIAVRGYGGDSESHSVGVQIDGNANANTKITSARGNISVSGYGGLYSTPGRTGNHGINIFNSGSIESTGAAGISLFGQAATGGTDQHDIRTAVGSNVIGGGAATGNIAIDADTLELANLNVETDGTVTVKPRTVSRGINLGGATGGLDLSDAELGYFNAGTFVIGDSTNGTGNIDIDSWDLSAKSHNVQVFGNTINLAGIILGSGSAYLYSKGTGGVTVSADSLSNSTGNLTVLSQGAVHINQRLENDGAGKINLFAGWDGTSGITTPALFDLDTIGLGATARNVTIGANGTLKSGSNNTAVLIASTGSFLNNATAGANAILTPSGRYMIYGDHPDDTVKGGLTAKNLYNTTYAGNLPSSIVGDSRFLYNYQPTLNLRADDIAIDDPLLAVYSYSPLNLRADDLLIDAVTGTGNYTLGGLSGNTRPIVFTAGSLTSPMGYALAFVNGVMTITSLPADAGGTSPALPDLGPVLTYSVNTPGTTSETAAELPRDYDSEVASHDHNASSDCLVMDGVSFSCIIQ